MSVDIENLFKAKARSSWEFLTQNGQGCYLPAYQRPYSWKTSSVTRLFDDAIHGLDMLQVRPETVTFLGTVITIHDTKYKTVSPLYVDEVAQRVMTIIDGQQRLCTFVMANIAFHNSISLIVNRFKKKEDRHFKWLLEQCSRFLPDLQDTFMLDMRTGDDKYRYYPRIIRAYDDAWSRKVGQAKYDSPIASLIWNYFDHLDVENPKDFKHKALDGDGEAIPEHNPVVGVFSSIQKIITTRTGERSYDLYDFPDLVTLLKNKKFVEELLGVSLPEEVFDYVKEPQDNIEYKKYCQLIKTLFLAKYMSQRMAFTVVTTESEDDAFDMFEALNTTGEPLTAYETFKPEVIKTETLEKYEQSVSKAFLDDVEEYLNRFPKANDKQSATSGFLVPFALAEDGFKLPKKLNEQRIYLRTQYAEIADIEAKREFVKRFSHVAKFMNGGWNSSEEKVEFGPLKVSDEEALFGFLALRSMGHEITIAPLSRFFADAWEAKGGEHYDDAKADFISAIKATVAFSMLWRGAFGKTENIDSQYRMIMKSGIQTKGIKPLCARPPNDTGVVSLANYKNALASLLKEEGGVDGKESWVEKAANVRAYAENRQGTRFLLLLASSNSKVDSENLGLIKAGRTGLAELLKPAVWADENYFTIEHIAPQNNDGTWDDGIYEEGGIEHNLGNLLLLPKEVNSWVGNRSWERKRLAYSLLSSTDMDEFEERKKDCANVGFNISNTAIEVLENSKYLSMCESVSKFDKDWSKEIIERRGRRIAELAYDKLAEWLK